VKAGEAKGASAHPHAGIETPSRNAPISASKRPCKKLVQLHQLGHQLLACGCSDGRSENRDTASRQVALPMRTRQRHSEAAETSPMAAMRQGANHGNSILPNGGGRVNDQPSRATRTLYGTSSRTRPLTASRR
jgi:hypothetical protein